ncbi:MAG: class I SAM-dependent methyltransferase [Saprospiraceae bacterium]|nr:class I SAM-dependent methyltransferase [Saprospiraceae bacterium]
MYGKNWDQYYVRTYGSGKNKALWDVPVDQAIALDYQLFAKSLNPDLPIIDIGCGTGTQSVFLLNHYPRVLGVDVSAEAIKVARENHQIENLEFDILDVTDTAQARFISKKIGPANIYMRGVLHQILDQHLPAFRQTIQTLLGTSGTMYCIEVSDQIRAHFKQENEKFSSLPERLRQVFISNLPPKGLSVQTLPSFFPPQEFDILSSGEAKLNTNICYSDGEAIFIPAIFGLVKHCR